MASVDTLLRQQRLLLRSEMLRQRLADEVHSLQAPLGLVDRAKEGADWVMRHPLVPAALLGLMVALRPGRVMRWGTALWSTWRMLRRLQAWARMSGLGPWMKRGG